MVELDIADDNSVQNTVQSILNTAGHIDVVVNTADLGTMGLLESFSLDQVHTVFEVNTFGLLRLNNAALSQMRERGSGLLIHISSTRGRIDIPFMAPYTASKAALEKLVESYTLNKNGRDISCQTLSMR